MSSCNVSVPDFQREEAGLDVSAKYKQLMSDTLAEDSLYTRAKDTLNVIFKDLQISEAEKAKISAEYVAQMSIQLSNTAMASALKWAQEERDGAYTLAKVKAETEVELAKKLKTEEEICLVSKQTELQCANIKATISTSIRENGRVASYEADGCTPESLQAEGLRYQQTKQVEAATYQTFADAYRKSGVVQIGTDTQDGVLKGLSGPTDKITGGYTNQQTLNAERQRQSYEDSKINHLVNGAAVVTGQMMSAEVNPDSEILEFLKDGMRKLKSPNGETPDPFQGV